MNEQIISHGFGDRIVITRWEVDGQPVFIGRIEDHKITVMSDSFTDCVNDLFKSCFALLRHYEKQNIKNKTL